jgi:large subunit ribosomal protein L18
MDNYLNKRDEKRKRRVLRVRKKVRGTAQRPRLSVAKSNQHLFVQLIDDENHMTLASLGTYTKQMRDAGYAKKTKEAARYIGQKIAAIAKQKQIEAVIFDRGRLKYHGIIAELAHAAREAGLQF